MGTEPTEGAVPVPAVAVKMVKNVRMVKGSGEGAEVDYDGVDSEDGENSEGRGGDARGEDGGNN